MNDIEKRRHDALKAAYKEGFVSALVDECADMSNCNMFWKYSETLKLIKEPAKEDTSWAELMESSP